MIKILFIALINCIVLSGINSQDTASAFSLEEEIHKELSSNLPLKMRETILNIVGIENGYVAINMSTGNSKIRKNTHIDGYDIQSAPLKGSTVDDNKDIIVINNALDVIRNMNGVKSVRLTGYHSDDSFFCCQWVPPQTIFSFGHI